MAANVIISTASVPSDYCPPSIQTAWPFLVTLLSAQLEGSTNTFNYGKTTPAPEDQGKPWLRLNSDNTPDRWYVFTNGAWLAPHSSAEGTIILYEGTEASIDTFDGGEAGVIASTTGPMWAKVSGMEGRFPVFPGTLGTTVIGVNSTGGVHEVTLTEPHIPKHTHEIKYNSQQDVGVDTNRIRHLLTQSGSLEFETKSWGGDVDGNTVAHTNLPPYVGKWFLKKTARKYYRI